MLIEINPKNILNLENVFKVFYKLHPIVLDFLLYLALDELEKLDLDLDFDLDLGNILKRKKPVNDDYENVEEDSYLEHDNDKIESFNYYLQFFYCKTNEYIPIKFYIEVDDLEKVKKIKDLIRVMEISKDPENYYDSKREVDYEACFSKGYKYSLTNNGRNKMMNLFRKFDFVTLIKIINFIH